MTAISGYKSHEIGEIYINIENIWGEPERALLYDLAIRNGSMVHARNQHDQKRTRSSHVPPSITYGIWFHGS